MLASMAKSRSPEMRSLSSIRLLKAWESLGVRKCLIVLFITVLVSTSPTVVDACFTFLFISFFFGLHLLFFVSPLLLRANYPTFAAL